MNGIARRCAAERDVERPEREMRLESRVRPTTVVYEASPGAHVSRIWHRHPVRLTDSEPRSAPHMRISDLGISHAIPVTFHVTFAPRRRRDTSPRLTYSCTLASLQLYTHARACIQDRREQETGASRTLDGGPTDMAHRMAHIPVVHAMPSCSSSSTQREAAWHESTGDAKSGTERRYCR